MNFLERIFNDYKEVWFERQIQGYKGPVYYRMLKIDEYSTEIQLLRYYPTTQKWQYDNLAKLEFAATMTMVEDEQLTIDLEAKYALFLLMH